MIRIVVKNVEVWSDDKDAIEAAALSIGKVMSEAWLEGCDYTETLNVIMDGVDYFVRELRL